MAIIVKDGKVYQQVVIENEVDLKEEERKLSSMIGSMENDARELQEYNEKIMNINALPIDESLKEQLKSNIIYYSPSGVKQEDVDEQRAKIDGIKAMIGIE